jgi:hypothetical protein
MDKKSIGNNSLILYQALINCSLAALRLELPPASVAGQQQLLSPHPAGSVDGSAAVHVGRRGAGVRRPLQSLQHA